MTQTMSDLALATVRHETELLVCVRGRLDAHTKDLLVGCARSWAADGVRTLVVDLSELSLVDGFGVAALLRCRRVMRARAGTLRGLHYQAEPHSEAKLVRCTRGAIWDVAVDLRPGSATRYRWHAAGGQRAGGVRPDVRAHRHVCPRRSDLG